MIGLPLTSWGRRRRFNRANVHRECVRAIPWAAFLQFGRDSPSVGVYSVPSRPPAARAILLFFIFQPSSFDRTTWRTTRRERPRFSLFLFHPREPFRLTFLPAYGPPKSSAAGVQIMKPLNYHGSDVFLSLSANVGLTVDLVNMTCLCVTRRLVFQLVTMFFFTETFDLFNPCLIIELYFNNVFFVLLKYLYGCHKM